MLTIKDEAVDAFEYLSRIEGIIPAIESAHAVAYAKKIVPQMDKDESVVITLSGRGDKDCAAIARYRGEDLSLIHIWHSTQSVETNKVH